MSFICWKKPQLQLSKGNCLRAGRLHILQIGQIRKEYESALFSCAIQFSLQTGLRAQNSCCHHAGYNVLYLSLVIYTSQILYFFTENVQRSFTFHASQTLCNMVFVSEGRYSLCWLLTSLELLFSSGQLFPRRNRKIWLVDSEETRGPGNLWIYLVTNSRLKVFSIN